MAIRYQAMMSNGTGAVAAGSIVIVPAGQATQALVRDYPIQIADMAGTTAQRPQGGDPDFPGGVPASIDYYDTTLTYVVVSDGTGKWRNPANGNAV